MAHHKGSAFGSLGQPAQPSQEMFENLLARELKLTGDRGKITESNNCHLTSAIWLEDESQRIGNVNIPTPFFHQMRNKKLYFVNIPFEERLNFIVRNYGAFEKEKLVNAIIRIKKRLGGLETQTAINYLIEDNVKGCFEVLLNYYDKQYLKGLQNREDLASLYNKIEVVTVADETNAMQLLSFVQKEKVI